MKSGFGRLLRVVLAATTLTSGCMPLRYHKQEFNYFEPLAEQLQPGGGPEQLKLEDPVANCSDDAGTAIPPGPDEVGSGAEVQYWDLSLEEAISLALQQSPVMRDLGGTVLRNPEAIRAVQDPSIVFTDPRFGEEAALSQFDAMLASSMLFEKNDRVFNNLFVGTNGTLQQDLNNYNVELRKRAATGTQMALRHVTDYDYNNQVGNRFGNPSGSWNTFFEGEVRQPLLQGAGMQFNRIAGPSSDPSVINGVLVARVRSDISLADFEAGVRDLISDVENAYWDLHYAYYDLNSKKDARDTSLRLWRLANARATTGIASQANVEQVLEQYWRFESDVRSAENGRLVEGTASRSGSGGGSFRSFSGGVRVAERRLRLIAGLPVNSLQLIRPSTTAPSTPVKFDWGACANDALIYRPELRRQRWIIKQRDMELLASRNYLAPRLDMVGRYRWRGLGEDLISQGNGQYDSAWGNLADGHNDEWQVGVELDMPLGFRQANAGVRFAELRLTRERAILKEQERTVLYGLSNAFGEVRRAFTVLESQANRLEAGNQQLKILEQQFEQSGGQRTADAGGEQNPAASEISTDLVLEAQRRLIESNIAYNQAVIDYALALKNVHFGKGTLLDYNNIVLNESASTPGAYASAGLRKKADTMSYLMRTPPIGAGPVNQQPLPGGEIPVCVEGTEATATGK